MNATNITLSDNHHADEASMQRLHTLTLNKTPMVPKYEWKLNMKIVKSAGKYRKYTYS